MSSPTKNFATSILADNGTYCHPRSKEIPFKRPALITIAIELILFTLFQDAQYVPVPAVILRITSLVNAKFAIIDHFVSVRFQ